MPKLISMIFARNSNYRIFSENSQYICAIFSELKKKKGGFNLYEKIKQFAKEKGIPIRKLEMMANISQGSICKWGEISPSFDKVVRVSKILGIDVSELIDRKE